MKIRKATEADVSQLLPLMHELAEFERYADAFAVTEEILREQGFRRSPPDFYCLVAEENGTLAGILVYYFVAFTYRAKPNLIVKELYVAESHRRKGVGNLLMKAPGATSRARRLRRDQMVGREMEHAWHRILRTTRREIDPDWHEFQMSEEAFRKLAQL